MRSLARIAAAPLFLAVAACSGGDEPAAVDASLERDLRLASTTSLALPPAGAGAEVALETAPLSMPTPAPQPRRAPTGERRVRSERPTATAAPVAEQAAGSDAESVLETITQPTGDVAESESGAAEEVVDAAPLPRPIPASTEGAGQGSGDYGDTGRSGDGGWGWGGVVIRGGDIDDCRIEPRRGTRPRPVYRPGGGVATGRWPVAERPQTTTGGSEGERAGRWPVANRGGGSRSGGSSVSPGSRSGGRWRVGG